MKSERFTVNGTGTVAVVVGMDVHVERMVERLSIIFTTLELAINAVTDQT